MVTTSTPQNLDLITVAQAAVLADRSKAVIRRWIREGWIPETSVYIVPGPRGAWLIDRKVFEERVPKLHALMAERTGGRGHYGTDAYGNLR